MKTYSLALILLISISASADAQRSSFQSPLTLMKDGYQIDFGEDILDPKLARSVKVDVALVNLSAFDNAKTEEEADKIIERIYQDPSNFSIVSGILEYLNGATARLITKARFKFDLKDVKYTMVVVENNGKDNSGSKVAPQAFYVRKKGNCGCTSCGCCCYRKATGSCVYCGIKVTK
ncbi:MAG: hypothetical protein IPL46_34515 [Saprospiraceae bacterium]|nr:hypothetical protein [Saprospiraceae bacterium]